MGCYAFRDHKAIVSLIGTYLRGYEYKGETICLDSKLFKGEKYENKVDTFTPDAA